MWSRLQTKAGRIHDDLRLTGRGLESGGNHHGWPAEPLKLGDDVTIRIVDADTFDDPTERMTPEELAAKGERLKNVTQPN